MLLGPVEVLGTGRTGKGSSHDARSQNAHARFARMTDARLTIESVAASDSSTLALSGEIDPQTTDQLDAAIDGALGTSAHLVLDLAGVTFIDSAGLRSLIRAHRLTSESSGSLVLRAPRPSTLRVLEITGLTDELTIDPPTAPLT